MNLLPAITQWLNGPHAGATMLTLRVAFFAVFVLTALRLLWGRGRTGGRGGLGFPLLAIVTMAALLGMLAYQSTWQLFGARRVQFMRFMRSHNPRPASLVKRGSILDCHGTVMALDDALPGDPWRRRYPLGPAAAHVTGYFDPRFGMAGIERAADLVLSGYGGSAMDELNRLGRNLLEANQAEGTDVRLTIDARLQRKAWEAMRGKRGAVVVLRPADGAIRVLLSMPSFDPQNPGDSQHDTEAAPLLNRALQGLYPPGSTFKILMAALAAEQRISPRFDCPAGGFRAAGDARPIRDSEYYIWERDGRVWPGRGRIGLRDGFVHSSNVYFAQLGLACQPDAFNALMRRAGLEERVVVYRAGAEQMATLAGAVPQVTSADRRTRAQLAIGQGRMVVTPLHVAMWTAAVATGGELRQPRLDAGEAPCAPVRVVSAAASAATRALMREAVQHGTGRPADIPGLSVCGKTGTAQAPGGEDHAWFTCFAPAAAPALVVTVLVERGGYGSRAALPVARELLEEAVRLGMISGAAPRKAK
ncbi:MAG: penicillin-binding transpeptidase domain-containing protein [Kiritimatiellae bacterium]|nr:penicillin-binding transpeptidase domain-containing protein [Kiritimatiellia bacterium]